MAERELRQNVWRPLLGAFLIGAVASAVAQLAERAVPSWHDPALPLFCGFAALQALVVYQLRQEHEMAYVRGPLAGALEIVSLAVCRQLWVPVFGGQPLLWRHFPVLDLSAMALAIATFLPIGLAWLAGNRIAATYAMVNTDERVPASGLSASTHLGVGITGGGMVLAFAGLLLAASPGGWQARGAEPPISWLLLLYLLAAVLLLADIRYSSLLASWQRSTAPWKRSPGTVPPEVRRGWRRQCALMLVGALGFSILVPLAGGTVMGRIPGQDILRLFGSGGGTPDSGTAGTPWPPPDTGPAQMPTPEAGSPVATETSRGIHISIPIGVIAAAIGLILPWLLLIGSVAYRVRRRGERSTGVDIVGFVNELIRDMVQALRSWPRGLHRPHLPRPRRELLPGAGKMWNRSAGPAGSRTFRLVRTRTDRERIVCAFDGVARRAARRGIARHPGRVPLELAAGVSAVAPESEDDIHELCRRYEQARYSLRAIDGDDARIAERLAKRVRGAL